MKEVTAYQCEFCEKKIYRIKSSCKRHEKTCFANPKTKSCRTCKHAIKDKETVYVRPQGNQNYGDADYDIGVIFCEVINEYLVHPSEPSKLHTNCNLYEQGEKLF